MTLSIIIPVYNTERYVRGTLQSIFSQPNANCLDFEVIIVNDGTRDQSMDIVREFINQSNLVILEQSNQGLSCARNAGLAKARGKYVWFVDSDDQLEKDGLMKVMALLDCEKGIDIFGFGINQIEEASSKELFSQAFVGKNCQVFFNRNIDQIIIPLLTGPTQRYIFRKDFLEKNEILFFPRLLHEDMEFLFHAFCLCEHFYISETPVYRYLIRSNGSIMSSLKMKNFHDLNFILDRTKQIAEQTDKKKKRTIISYLNLFRASTVFFILIAQPSKEWEADYYDFLRTNSLKFRKIAFNGIIPSLKRKRFRHALTTIMITISPTYYNKKAKFYLLSKQQRKVLFNLRS